MLLWSAYCGLWDLVIHDSRGSEVLGKYGASSLRFWKRYCSSMGLSFSLLQIRAAVPDRLLMTRVLLIFESCATSATQEAP